MRFSRQLSIYFIFLSSNLSGEVLGPINPYKNQFGTKPIKAEAAAIDDWTFNQQYENYQRSGYAIDSETNNILGYT